LRAAGSSPAPLAVWVFWRLIWHTESLDRGLILVCRFSLSAVGSAYKLRRRRWLSGTILASLVLDSTGFWVRISARTPILRNITTGGDITGGFCPGAGFPSCHKSIYRISEDNFRGSACVSEWMLISVKDGGLVFHNLRLHKDNKLEQIIIIAYKLRLRPALVYKVGCTCVTLYCTQMGKRLS
jgi:hypothetical protein